jgi:hypothetical protein
MTTAEKIENIIKLNKMVMRTRSFIRITERELSTITDDREYGKALELILRDRQRKLARAENELKTLLPDD